MIKNRMPDLDEILKMREENNTAYCLFFGEILSHVVGRSVWKEACRVQLVSDIATASAEAFALILLENSFDVWQEQASLQNGVAVAAIGDSSTTDAARTKYTRHGPGTRKNMGWTTEGLDRFNDLAIQVQNNRINDKGVFERKYLDDLGKTIASTQRRRSAIQEKPNFVIFVEPDEKDVVGGALG